MRSYFFLGILISLMSFVSCRKDPTITVYTKEVRAGVYDSTFYHVEFSVPLELSVLWDSQNLYGFGTDSIDLDGDLESDIIIELNLLNEDSLHLLTTTYPDPFPNLILKTDSGFEISTSVKYTYMGMGAVQESIFVSKHVHGERLDTISNWKNKQIYGYSMYQENPTFSVPFGDWYSCDTINYMGVMLDGHRCGWIEVDLTDTKNPKFLSYAISN